MSRKQKQQKEEKERKINRTSIVTPYQDVLISSTFKDIKND